MIKCGKLKGKDDEVAEQCILYTQDGSKALGYFPYSKHGGEEGAKKAAEKREGVVQFFKQKHQGLLDALEAFGAPVVLKYLLDKSADCEACQEVVKSYVEAQAQESVEKQFKPPEGWNDPRSWLSSKAGAEAIRKKAWDSMGGKQHLCAGHMAGKVEDPDRFCAALKDTVTGDTHWRKGHGGGKSEKSFADTAEEALTMLEKDEKDIDLSELERWLEGKSTEPATPTAPAASAEPEPVAEPEPAPMVEELPNDFRTFLLQDHARRQAGVLATLGEEVTEHG